MQHSSFKAMLLATTLIALTVTSASAAETTPAPAAPQQTSYTVYFEFDQSYLTADGKAVVASAANTAKQGAATTLDVTGHADRAGDEDYNMGLSARRAQTVRTELLRLGIPDAAIQIAWMGESELAVSTPDGVPEPQNRRASVIVINPALMGQAPTSATATAAAEPAAPPSFIDTLKLYGHLEGGMTFNANNPPDNLNFGHLFTDRADSGLFNQLLITLERPVDSSAGSYAWGFKLQAMYGSDARYTHFLGEFDRITTNRYQIDIVEAFFQEHLPVLTDGGIDLKIGQFVTLEGAEVIDSVGNFFYTHTYIFNFGIPFKHTGIMAITHLTPMIDLYSALVTGVNTSLGKKGDNNGSLAFHGGLGLKLFGGAVTAFATTHIGPENPRGTPGVDVNGSYRYLNDITVIWKINDKWASITDANFIYEEGFNARGYGVAQYVTYAVNDWLSAGLRGEVWRDEDGFFVAAYPGTLDFVNLQRGFPATVIGGGKTTYGAITAGINIKIPLPKDTAVQGLMIRPEIRYDWTLTDTTPFSAGTRGDQLTFGFDATLSF